MLIIHDNEVELNELLNVHEVVPVFTKGVALQNWKRLHGNTLWLNSTTYHYEINSHKNAFIFI